jgi:tRNA(His) 5'-end guanylyltransferase
MALSPTDGELTQIYLLRCILDQLELSDSEPGHINNLYNEILFKEFGINYNNEPECFKKGTVLYRDVSQFHNMHLTVYRPMI